MANPNSEIWGAPESWINAKHFNFVGDGDPDTRTSKPKTADFGNISGTLAQGDLVGKTPINNPIDGTICPCGQDPAQKQTGRGGKHHTRQCHNIDRSLQLVHV